VCSSKEEKKGNGGERTALKEEEDHGVPYYCLVSMGKKGGKKKKGRGKQRTAFTSSSGKVTFRSQAEGERKKGGGSFSACSSFLSEGEKGKKKASDGTGRRGGTSTGGRGRTEDPSPGATPGRGGKKRAKALNEKREWGREKKKAGFLRPGGEEKKNRFGQKRRGGGKREYLLAKR